MIILSEEKKQVWEIADKCREAGNKNDISSLMFYSGQMAGMAIRYLAELDRRTEQAEIADRQLRAAIRGEL